MELRGKQNPENTLILTINEEGQIRDITKDVLYLKETPNSYLISFSSSGKLKYYHFRKNRVKIFLVGKLIDVNGQTILLDNNHYLTYDKIINFGPYYKVFFGNTSTIGTKLKLVERESLNGLDNDNVFNYYMELARYANKISLGDNSIESNLLNLYNKINKVDKSTFLNSYLKRSIFNDSLPHTFIHPFGLNKSQNIAIENAFRYNISVIEGPPGTGKTQTIMNIIANAIINNKKIAVISNNNTAIANIYEKLEENGLEFLCANLGNYDNVNRFFETDYQAQLKNFLSKTKVGSVSTSQINEGISLLIKAFDCENELWVLRERLNEVKVELNNYEKKIKFDRIEFKFSTKMDLKALLKLRNLLKFNYEFNILEKLFFKSLYGIKYKLIFEQKEALLFYLDKLYYQLKMKEITNKIKKDEDFLKNHSFNILVKKHLHKSMLYFKNFLVRKYTNDENVNFTINNYRTKSSLFTNRFPLVLSTTHSLLRNVGRDFHFDLLVIDEASQSDILTSLLTFSLAKSVVIVGDSKQLPQIDNQAIYKFSDELITLFKIPSGYQYKDNSILNSIKKVFLNVPITLLKEHYRCEPRIIRFCNKKYYANEMIIRTKEGEEDSIVIVRTVPGNHARKNPQGTGQYNLREVDEIIEIIKEGRNKEIGIITPFRYQANVIREKVKDYDNVEVDTIHRFQGRQKDIIILSTVVNDLCNDEISEFISNFVTNDRLLNVAISRAKAKLYLIVSNKVYNSKNNSIKDLIEYTIYNFSPSSQEVGTIISVFDCLYKDNNFLLKEMKKKLKKVSNFMTENIIHNLLEDILKVYHNLEFVMFVKLSHLVKTLIGFTDYELKYINNPLTHVDFVVYNNVTKTVILVIEVDGIRYHEQSQKQSLHDEIKDRALQANEIPFLRLKTNESNERARIINKLNEASNNYYT